MIDPLAAAYGIIRHLSLSLPAHPPDTGARDEDEACEEMAYVLDVDDVTKEGCEHVQA